jgi:CHAT domain-containing protein
MEHKEVAAALEVADSSRASVLTGKVGNEVPSRNQFIAKVQSAASSANSIILFYWIAPDRSYLWLISGSGIKSFDLPQMDQTLHDAASYRYLIEEEKRDLLQDQSVVGRRLYDALIGPVQRSIPKGANVILVPDGALHNLNFETLLAGDGTHYWIDDVSISIAPSRPKSQRWARRNRFC